MGEYGRIHLYVQYNRRYNNVLQMIFYLESFLLFISFQPNVVDLRYFKLYILLDQQSKVFALRLTRFRDGEIRVWGKDSIPNTTRTRSKTYTKFPVKLKTPKKCCFWNSTYFIILHPFSPFSPHLIYAFDV